MSPVLEVDRLVKHFPIAGSRALVQAVNGVSLAIAKGETLALVGESGSGKTTVGRCVIGLIEPTAGAIRFRGEPIDRRRNIRSSFDGSSNSGYSTSEIVRSAIFTARSAIRSNSVLILSTVAVRRKSTATGW